MRDAAAPLAASASVSGDSGPRISVVIPAKNEAGNIRWVLEQLPPEVDEVVLVDGHSSDATVAVAQRARPDVVVVTDGTPGKGAALRSGVEAATGTEIVMIDADGSMDPKEVGRFLRSLHDGHDLVKGSRFLPGGGTADMTPLRDIGHRCLLALANALHGTRQTDLCYGYAAFRRDAFMGLGLTADGFEIEAQLFLRAQRRGLRVAEVPSFEAPRREGNSNLNTFRDGWRVLWTIVAERLPRILAPAPQALQAIVGDPSAEGSPAHGAAVEERSTGSAMPLASRSAARARRRPGARTPAPTTPWAGPRVAAPASKSVQTGIALRD